VFAISWASSLLFEEEEEKKPQVSPLERKISGLQGDVREVTRKLQAAESKLNAKIFQLQLKMQDLRYSRRITCDSVEDDYTNWQTGSHYSNRFLDRHHVICGTDEFLIGFKLQTKGRNEMRYAYQCCTIRIN